MKKIYITPSIEVIEIDTENMISTSINTGGSLPGVGNGGDDESGDKEGDSNGRRGEWGNLWL